MDALREPRLPLEDVRVALEEGRTLVLLVRAGRTDTYRTLAARFTSEEDAGARVAAANPGRGPLQKGSWYRVPLEVLSLAWREKALRSLFPADGPSEAGWIHRPQSSTVDSYNEGAWEAALWFTGDGRNFEVILRANGLADPQLGKSREISIPAHLLLPPFRIAWERSIRSAEAEQARSAPPPVPTGERSAAAAPPVPPPGRGSPPRDPSLPSSPREREPGPDAGAASPSSAAEDEESPALALSRAADLEFGEDEAGPYALYRLKRGEALYSAVVVRYTGRVDPDDVAEAAAIIVRRSGIRSVTDIPVGYAVRIPRSMILPEFLPPGDSRRREIEAERREATEAAKVQTAVRSRDLEGIHVILDAGHGGVDPGATIAGLSEHEYAYDVLCRVKRILETTTSAKVHPLIQDPDLGFVPRPARTLRASGDERILTTPAHVNGDPSETSLGVHLRWLLANSIERRLERSGVDPARTVFVSFHADVLHPTLRGAMIYVPGERYRRGTYSCRDAECARYAEAREVPSVRFDRAERLASEGLSRRFAARVIASFRKSGIGVHPDLPIRDRIVRRGRDWLPAVLRGNSVPVKVLVEMVNLNNPSDRALIQDPEFREQFASAFVRGLLSYYGASPSPPRPKPAHGRPSRSARSSGPSKD